MNVRIEVIPHKDQRYETVGDWFFEPNGDITIRVSKLANWKREMLVAVHELVEVLLCKSDHVSQKAVDEFDILYEKHRSKGDTSEPGDWPDAPYARQHCIATGIERILAAELKVCWKDYEAEIEAL